MQLLKHTLLWDTVKGPPPDLKGENPFSFLQWFYSGTFGLYPLYPARQGYSPSGKVITESWEYHLKGNPDGYLKKLWLFFSVRDEGGSGVELDLADPISLEWEKLAAEVMLQHSTEEITVLANVARR